MRRAANLVLQSRCKAILAPPQSTPKNTKTGRKSVGFLILTQAPKCTRSHCFPPQKHPKNGFVMRFAGKNSFLQVRSAHVLILSALSQREYFLLHYVVRGKGIFRRGKREYTLQAGEIFVIRPGEVTYYEADMRDPWEYMWAGFDCAPPFAALLEQDVLRLPGALQNFSRIAGCGDMPAKEWRICAQLYELFAELDAARGPAQGHGGNYVGQAVNYIESNYSQPMRVQDIAAGLGLNRSYFCRFFRQQTGLSPQEYIVSCRLAKAAQFMTEHGMSQEEAARQAGYPDVFSFSRMFRRKYGMPPGRYAARARQKQGG